MLHAQVRRSVPCTCHTTFVLPPVEGPQCLCAVLFLYTFGSVRLRVRPRAPPLPRPPASPTETREPIHVICDAAMVEMEASMAKGNLIFASMGENERIVV